jgi:hypothetical protein
MNLVSGGHSSGQNLYHLSGAQSTGIIYLRKKRIKSFVKKLYER